MNFGRLDGNIPRSSMRQFAPILIVLLTLTSCKDNPPTSYPTVAPFDANAIALGPGDKVSLTIYYGSHEISAQYVIDPAGDIEVQYIGPVKVTGQPVSALQKSIKERLADGYLVDPIVSLTVLEINSQTLSVFGQVGRTGTIKYVPGMTIVDAIADSGGFSPLARKNMVKVTRMLNGKPEIYKIPVEMIADGSRPNFPVIPGDQIFVPERAW
jgi:polysaccharide export outer membrane protein